LPAPPRSHAPLPRLPSTLSQQERDARLERLHAERLPSRDMALAAYLAARAMDGRAVDGQDLNRLRDADESLHDTRQRLPHGRGNVDHDLAATELRNLGRVAASRGLARKLVAESGPKNQHFIHAAAACALGSGNCGEYANIGFIVHSARLLPGETSNKVKHKTLDHAWAESRLPDDVDREHTIVIDGWGEGPPVFAPDGAFTVSADNIRLEAFIRPPKPHDWATSQLDKVEQQIRTRHGEAGLQALLPPAPSKLPPSGIWAPTPVVDDAFSARVKPRLAAGGLSAQIVAAGAARSLGQPIHALKADVPAILEIAQRVLP
jgi:hypothetical protein